MKLIYKGKFSGNPEDIPHGEHRPGAVKFRELDDPKKLSLVANLLALGITALAIAGYVLRLRAWGGLSSGVTAGWQFMLGALLSLAVLFPHELLHGLCFRKEVYLYTYWSKGMLFVTGPEDMSKGRFVFMSLLPNLVFGVVPYILAMIWPFLGVLGALGAISLGAGAGDYYNVFNALTQMPRGARTYLYSFNSWWYLPEGVTAPEKKPKPAKEKASAQGKTVAKGKTPAKEKESAKAKTSAKEKTSAKAKESAKAKTSAKEKAPAKEKESAKAKTSAKEKAPAKAKEPAKAKTSAKEKAPVKAKEPAKAKTSAKEKAPAKAKTPAKPKPEKGKVPAQAEPTGEAAPAEQSAPEQKAEPAKKPAPAKKTAPAKAPAKGKSGSGGGKGNAGNKTGKTSSGKGKKK